MCQFAFQDSQQQPYVFLIYSHPVIILKPPRDLFFWIERTFLKGFCSLNTTLDVIIRPDFTISALK